MKIYLYYNHTDGCLSLVEGKDIYNLERFYDNEIYCIYAPYNKEIIDFIYEYGDEDDIIQDEYELSLVYSNAIDKIRWKDNREKYGFYFSLFVTYNKHGLNYNLTKKLLDETIEYYKNLNDSWQSVHLKNLFYKKGVSCPFH